MFYDELYEGSDFVFFAVDFVDEIAELEALLDSQNETLVLKVLTLLKEKSALKTEHKQSVIDRIQCLDIKSVIQAL